MAVLEPQQVIYQETFRMTCPHKECKQAVLVTVARIKGGKTANIEVKHET